MNLREQMAHDACALLNLHELGERAMHVASGATSGRTVPVRFIAQPERQTIRRAFIWTRAEELTAGAGDVFTIRRNEEALVYRVLYADTAETAMRRHICHEQLSDTFRVMAKDRYKAARGADAFAHADVGTEFRGKFVISDAEHETRKNRRVMRVDRELYCEVLPDLTTDMVIVDSDGKGYRIDNVEKPIDRIDLPYITVSRTD